MTPIDTAVILTAGNGTRRLPITRVIDKVMLPVGNRPTVDYVVEYCLGAGIRRIIFVVQRLESLISQYYGEQIDITEVYPHLNATGIASVEYAVHDQAITGYGTAPAVLCVQELLQGTQQFVVVAGDAFLYDTPGNPIKALIEGGQNAAGALVGIEVPPQDASNLGILAVDKAYHLTDLIERPDSLPDGWEPLANVSHYLFSQAVFPELKAVLPTRTNEYLITDAILSLAHRSGITVVPMPGLFLDSGSLDKWVAANQLILEKALPHPSFTK